MGMPEPMNDAAMIQGGFQHWDQQNAAAAAEKRQITPDSVLQHAWERIQAGEDPVAVARELKAHPAGQQLLASLRQTAAPQVGQSAPNPAPPDLGMQNGQPGLGAVGQMWPDARGGQPQQAQPAPQGPTPQPQGQSLGAPQPQPSQHQQMAAQIAPSYPQPQFQQSLGQMGQPMQGAPQVSPQDAGASGSIPGRPQQPGGGNFTPREDFGTPKFTGGDPINPRQWAQLQPIMPAMLAANSRKDVANTAADAKMETTNLNAQKALLVQSMKDRGASAHETNTALIELGKMTTAEQIAALRYQQAIESAKITAGGAMGAAGIRAKAGESELKIMNQKANSLQSAIASATKAGPEALSQPGTRERIQGLQRDLDAVNTRIRSLSGLGQSEDAPPEDLPPAPEPSLFDKAKGAVTDAVSPKPAGPKAPAPAKETTVRFSKSLNKTQWLDAAGKVLREASGDQRPKK